MSVSTSGPAPDHRAWIEVDLAAVVENARTVARVAGARLLPVVKANAYGLGAVAVSQALEVLDPWGYAVATVAEGAELRAAGITRRILVLTPARADELTAFAKHALTPVIDRPELVSAWSGRPFHVEIDTGMGRTGIRWDAVAAARAALDVPGCEGAFAQFHSADRGDDAMAQQLERFHAAVAALPRRPPLLHVANSAAALRGARYGLDLVRPGIFLYGTPPGEGLPEGRPAVHLRARVVSTRRLRAGDTVSYGARWAAPRDTTIATLAVGYADGPRRHLGVSGGAYVLLGGTRCRIAGPVTMDFAMVDAGDAAVAIADVATLIGTAGNDSIPLQRFAEWSGDVPWEVLSSFGTRLPRMYRP